ncbi:MAG: T9SS type A sorting domain-containing protein [Candidatus Latescibacteria bacterium]|nr:T9SS type A sorting domain-containing protein [Candidatus Latescibacterota bacterium]
MRCLLITIGLLAAPLGALALTWDFDEGTTWGWTAQESLLGTDGSPTTVYSEVEDGVWRIAPVPSGKEPAISLVSPLIGEDSALFDWVTLRLRIIHDRPTEGNLLMHWSNVESRRRKQEAGQGALPDKSGVYTIRSQLYPIQWENLTIDIRALEADPEAEIIWQDTLFHLRLDLALNTNPQGPADHPAFVEVDWIQLTGSEELLLGELQPQELAVEAGLPGALFAEPRFSVLGQGIGGPISQGTLGDVDGDGDADLVVVWQVWGTGWIIATSDGLGGLVPTREVRLSNRDLPRIAGGDFDGDGLLDLAFSDGLTTELWLNRGEDGFETILQLSDSYLLGLADGDGDGDVDLVVVEIDDLSSNVIMWINDGAAGFADSDRFDLETEEDLRTFPFPLAGQPVGEAVYLLWNRVCSEPVGPWRLTQPWAASPPPPLFFDAEVNPCDLHLLADLDGDGAVELVGTPERNLFFDFDFRTTYHGLVLWRVDASGGVERHPLLGPQVLVPSPNSAGRAIASDLTGDGLLDLAVVDVNVATGPALVVLVGQRDGVPVVEGRYPLPGIGDEVLAGDVNGDGATDLVVLGRSVEGGPGGAFVFLNQDVPVATAIAAETTTPTAFALGANYPNPFNPATIIPLAVAADAGDVDLTIYNVLGQPVRHVWTGPLAAGEHRLAWDGRDAQGQPVAAGVYVVRLHQGDQTRIRKMVKLE